MVPKIEKADSGSKYADKLVVFATELRKNKCRLEKKLREIMCYIHKKTYRTFVNRKQ